MNDSLRDAADHATAMAAIAAGAETLSADEVMTLVNAPTPLHFWRSKRQLTHTHLAKAVGISQSYLANIECGARKGDPELYKKLAHELHVRIEDLMVD